MPREAVQRREQLRLSERIERRHRHAGRGRREADEVALRAARLRHIEAREADRGRHHVEVAEDPGRRAGAREFDLKHEERGCDAEAHDVDEAIENSGEHDEPAGAVELAPRRQDHRPDAEEEIEEREQTRHHDDDAADREWRWSHAYSASTVPPTRTRSPRLTLTTGRAESGRKTSVREPNRIRPSRAPCATWSPGRGSVTMRRAMRPAICRTSTGPCGPRMPIEACSLSRLAFSVPACRNLPLW